MTLRVEDDRAAETSKGVYVSLSYSFNLGYINPQSIRMTTISHAGVLNCGAFPGADLDCDHAEIAFKTRPEAPLMDIYSNAIYPELEGSDHESKSSSKANTAYFMVNDVEYAKRLMKAFRHAVELCGGEARAILMCRARGRVVKKVVWCLWLVLSMPSMALGLERRDGA